MRGRINRLARRKTVMDVHGPSLLSVSTVWCTSNSYTVLFHDHGVEIERELRALRTDDVKVMSELIAVKFLFILAFPTRENGH